LKRRIEACNLAAREIRSGRHSGYAKTPEIAGDMKRKGHIYSKRQNFRNNLQGL